MAKNELDALVKNLKDCKVKEAEVKNMHKDPSRCQVMNCIGSAMLKSTRHKGLAVMLDALNATT